ncbi:ABC transporter ATP-binding protein [Clostridium boliviensis]|uniref:ABC transporter ATP-binding protein n=1 Tax=Clostridium boliviensis TaxID=318465 RepID=A0ABU4GQW8_9CLOT|nr:ABC transporter ATP-binding protein [Clostridium boliviensis]MDW2800036.1 ABC transporter ATP-binding protein [Clostridium boliviensis]
MLKIIKLEKKIGDFQLNINDLCLEEKIIHGVIGNNGSGKSTLIKLMTGLLKPDTGIMDFGTLTKRDIVITVPRPYMLHDTVYNNLTYPLKIRKQAVKKETIMEWIDRCGLSGKEKQYAPSLSSGERQKLSLARALIFEPKVVFIDETMANMDPDSVVLFEQIISDIQLKNPVTWIIVSHQLTHIYKLCECIHFMDAGSILTSGTPEELLQNADNPVIRQYMSKYLIGN